MFDKKALGGLMKKAQEMQKNMEKAQGEIAQLEINGESGAGLVKVTMTGKHDVKNVSIDDSILDDKEMLEDLIAAAINDANRKVEKEVESKMGAVNSGMPQMPGGMKFPF